MQKECVDATKAHRGKTDPCPGKPSYTTLCHLYFMRDTPRLYFLFFLFAQFALCVACLKLSLLSGWRLELVPSARSTATTNSNCCDAPAVQNVSHTYTCQTPEESGGQRSEMWRPDHAASQPLLDHSRDPNQLAGHLHSSMTKSAEQGTVNTH